AVGAVLAGRDLPLVRDEGGEGVRPGVEGGPDALRRHVLGLVVAVFFALAEFGVAPEGVRHLDAAVAALPDEGGVGQAHVVERLPLGVEVVRVAQGFGTPRWSRLVAT